MSNTLHRLSLICALTILATNAVAAEYTVTVEVDSRIDETLLSAAEIQPMSFPILGVTKATVVGSRCHAHSSPSANTTAFNGQPANETNSLCPGLTGEYSTIRFTGVKYANISITRTLQVQEKGGFRFGRNGDNWTHTHTATLSAADGTVDTALDATIDLYDKSLVEDGTLDFTYDITAAYQ